VIGDAWITAELSPQVINELTSIHASSVTANRASGNHDSVNVDHSTPSV
jgi:hypothetical protein